MFQKIKDLDFFASPVPSFNLDGEYSVKTWTGALSSMLVLALTFSFAMLKLEHMVLRKNPQLNSNTAPIDEELRYQTHQDAFMMAFSARRIIDGVFYLSDPRYVRWYATFISQKDGEYSEYLLPLYPCKKADMEKF